MHCWLSVLIADSICFQLQCHLSKSSAISCIYYLSCIIASVTCRILGHILHMLPILYYCKCHLSNPRPYLAYILPILYYCKCHLSNPRPYLAYILPILYYCKCHLSNPRPYLAYVTHLVLLQVSLVESSAISCIYYLSCIIASVTCRILGHILHILPILYYCKCHLPKSSAISCIYYLSCIIASICRCCSFVGYIMWYSVILILHTLLWLFSSFAS